MKPGIKTSIDSLTDILATGAESFFKSKGFDFDRIAFLGEVQPFLELISETAHFVGAGVFEMPDAAPES